MWHMLVMCWSLEGTPPPPPLNPHPLLALLSDPHIHCWRCCRSLFLFLCTDQAAVHMGTHCSATYKLLSGQAHLATTLQRNRQTDCGTCWRNRCISASIRLQRGPAGYTTSAPAYSSAPRPARGSGLSAEQPTCAGQRASVLRWPGSERPVPRRDCQMASEGHRVGSSCAGT